MTATVAVVGVILAALANLYWNFRNAKASRKLPFLNKQLDYCFEASEAAATLATTEDRDEWGRMSSRFLGLFFGPLAIVEDDDVARAMMKFALALDGVDNAGLPAHSLKGPSLELSGEIRKLLVNSWDIKDLNSVLNTDS